MKLILILLLVSSSLGSREPGGKPLQPEAGAESARNGLTSVDEQCAMCQFYVQRVSAVLQRLSGRALLEEAQHLATHTASHADKKVDKAADWQSPELVSSLATVENLNSPSTRAAPASRAEQGFVIPIKSAKLVTPTLVAASVPASATPKKNLKKAVVTSTFDKADYITVNFEEQDHVNKQAAPSHGRTLKGEPASTSPDQPANPTAVAAEAAEAADEPVDVGVIAGKKQTLLHLMDALPPELRHVADWQVNSRAAVQDQARFSTLTELAAAEMFNYCASRTPLRFLPYCKAVLTAFIHVTQGLRLGDHPSQICMRYDFCPASSYLTSAPHALSIFRQ